MGEAPGVPPPYREIRAGYDARTVRVYQAYSDLIADSALEHGRFVSPPFNMGRMTWIKPSFLWMMYRSGWGEKDPGQRRILGIDITRAGFEWALSRACLSHYEPALPYTQGEWDTLNREGSVKVQWDPERDLLSRPLQYRSIQVGIRGEAVERYVREWIVEITDITSLAADILARVRSGDFGAATRRLPEERVYPLPRHLARRLGESSDDGSGGAAADPSRIIRDGHLPRS